MHNVRAHASVIALAPQICSDFNYIYKDMFYCITKVKYLIRLIRKKNVITRDVMKLEWNTEPLDCSNHWATVSLNIFEVLM